MDLNQIIESQAGLLNALQELAAGKIDFAAYKPFGAPFGVYPQRDGKLMNRIRLTGGEATREQLNFIARICRSSGADFMHITTRQDIQLHGVSPLESVKVIRECTANGLPFRGGGGDTFRNIAITASSGIADDGSFDLAPYARYLTDVVFGWEKAYHLPRKIKIGFASANDAPLALRQDLGFVAATDADGNRGFAVYGGGGFGRESTVGVKLFDFLPAGKIAYAARAMVELFSDHGDREHRNMARIRFIVKRLGKEAFVALYHEYYEKFRGETYPEVGEPAADWSFGTAPVREFAPDASLDGDAAFRRWRALAVRPTRFGADRVAVTVYIPRGVLSPEEFLKLGGVFAEFGIPAVRLTFEQNILVPALHVSAPAAFYRALKQLGPDYTFESFAGQLDCCIGATICKIGVLDTPKYGAVVGEALDRYFEAHPEKRAKAALLLPELLHFSGCPNSCTAHEVARFGFQGCKKKIDDVLTDCFTLWRNRNYPASPIGEDAAEVIPAPQLAERVIRLLEEERVLD